MEQVRNKVVLDYKLINTVNISGPIYSVLYSGILINFCKMFGKWERNSFLQLFLCVKLGPAFVNQTSRS